MNGVTEIAGSSFQNEVLASEKPVLVDFYAPWCGPCRALAPTLEAVAKSYDGRLKVVKVNVDEAGELAAQYQIRGVPTLMVFRGGNVVDTMVGMPSPKTLATKLDAATV